MTNATQTITVSNHGTPAFPAWMVWIEPEDENGFCIDHECKMIGSFTTKKEAVDFANKQK